MVQTTKFEFKFEISDIKKSSCIKPNHQNMCFLF